jgi:twitching motility protein PilT
MQLANTLQGIVTQTLIPTADGKGRVAALEILFLDDAIRNLIRQGKIEQVYSYMQTGGRRGMQTMEQSLTELVQKNLITVSEAVGRSSRPDALVSALERAGIPIPTLSNDASPAAAPVLGAALRVAGS